MYICHFCVVQQTTTAKETFRTCQMYLIACIDRSLSGNNSIIGTQLMDVHSQEQVMYTLGKRRRLKFSKLF